MPSVLGLSDVKMQFALAEYFGKVKAVPRYIYKCIADSDPKYRVDLRHGNLFFPRDGKLNFSFFKGLYGYEMPSILKSYFSICHPEVEGFHKNAPYWSVGLASTLADNMFYACDLTNFKDEIDISKYIGIGVGGAYMCNFVIMERSTGRIFIEDYAEDDNRCFTFLSDSLTKFIRELEPPDYEKLYNKS